MRLAAFSLLPQSGGRVTFALVDGITGDLVDEAQSDLEPLSGEAATFNLDDPWGMGIVRFESGDPSSARGPVLTSSMEVLGPDLETRYGDIDNDADHDW